MILERQFDFSKYRNNSIVDLEVGRRRCFIEIYSNLVLRIHIAVKPIRLPSAHFDMICDVF